MALLKQLSANGIQMREGGRTLRCTSFVPSGWAVSEVASSMRRGDGRGQRARSSRAGKGEQPAGRGSITSFQGQWKDAPPQASQRHHPHSAPTTSPRLRMAQCSRRPCWLTVFIVLQVVGFTCLLLALITPSWQYVYLEDGRTEHHHGLWLDCKRDYSNEYGQTRDYYEKYYRRDHLQGPFDQFYLPPLWCVYKFDYWLDDEDWFEHGYDENRLQGDAYQHLFIGWKIAALTALSFATVCSLCATVMLFCAFCHRILVCVTAVLVSLALIACLIGNVVFYLFANYQDNLVLKEEDGVYQQYFGWSFYTSLVANTILLFSSIVGCVATSVTLGKKKAQLVKIELADDGDKQLLRDMHSSRSGFQRSRSAVYKIDSKDLRKWEREQMRIMQKRANSMPNIKKAVSQSSTVILPTTSITDMSRALSASNERVSVSFRDTQKVDDDDVVYEYVEAHPMSTNSEKSISVGPPLPRRPQVLTNLPVYDKVCDGDDEYLKPRSCVSTPIGMPLPPNRNLVTPLRSLLSRHDIEQRFETQSLRALTVQQSKPKTHLKADATQISAAPKPRPKPALRSSTRGESAASTNFGLTQSNFFKYNDPQSVQINTFQSRDETGRIRSLTNLALTEENIVGSGMFDRSRSPTEVTSSACESRGLRETNFDLFHYPSSENDRSLASLTYRPDKGQYQLLDDDRSTVSTTVSAESNRARPTTATFTEFTSV